MVSLLTVSATLDSVTTADTGIYSRSGRDSDDESCLKNAECVIDDFLSSEEESTKGTELNNYRNQSQNLNLQKMVE